MLGCYSTTFNFRTPNNNKIRGSTTVVSPMLQLKDYRDWVMIASIAAMLILLVWVLFLAFSNGDALPMPNESFDPLGDYEVQSLYTWLLFMLYLVCLAITIGFSLCTRYFSMLRAGLIVAGGCFLAVVLIANIGAIGYEERVTSHESVFHTKFNEFFCNLRIKEVCTQEDNLDKLQEMFGTTSNATAMERMWNTCNFTKAVSSFSSSDQDFLDSCNTTDSVDTWCGHRTMGLPTNMSSPLTPFSMNPGKYRSFQTEWPKNVKVNSIYYGFVVGFLIAVSCLSKKMNDANEELDLEENKLKQKLEV